ncbi:ankyrin repeat domain-containing protein 26-like isoform X3 [Littorina saxatilis]|uniref:ankyrin repeat domain-containing protein 26-like isoform X3 n=1 Tax=Littorina saxatilis TaxID=31220 RepID=UPI0038B68760
MKKFFKNIRKKSPARGGPLAEGSPKLDNRSTASLVLGYDVREKELGKLHKAAWLGDLVKVQQLAKKDPSPFDKDKRTPLHLACAQGYEKIVQELLEWKAKTNVGDADSRTPLMKAVECRHEGCVALLLQDRVELDSVDKDGNTSLHIAAADGSSKIVKLLCQAGANLTLKNREGLAPLHVAVREKQEEVCRNIISFRGQVDIEDNNLRTPLMYACQDGSVNLVKLFLEHGASTVHKDAKGWSADDCAVIQGHHACSQLISDHIMHQQRGSASSTPRSTAGSRSATPRGASPFALPPSTPRDKDSSLFGLPAADAEGDESGDETLSKASGKGAGSDSWGDDTDISAAEDKRSKGAASRVSLAKIVSHLPSESDDGESQKAGQEEKVAGELFESETPARRASAKSVQSQSSVEENSWAAADSPITPRKTAVRVSFKGEKELSEVHDITATDSEGESDHYTTIPETEEGPKAEGYTPSVTAAGSGLQLLPEKQRAGNKTVFMEDLGLGDVDDISEISEGLSDSKYLQPVVAPSPALDSEWDSTVKSDHHRPGILKKLNKADDASDWDTTDVEENAPPLPDFPQPLFTKPTEWESDVEEMPIPAASASVLKEDSDWDTTTEVATPRSNTQPAEPPAQAQTAVSKTKPLEESDESEAVEALVAPQHGSHVITLTSTPTPTITVNNQQVQSAVMPQEPPVAEHSHGQGQPQGEVEKEDDEESAWDSDGDDVLPSCASPAVPGDSVAQPQAGGGSEKKSSQHAASDTDDEMDNTETVSEWELERKLVKDQTQHLQKEKQWAEQEERIVEEEKRRQEEEHEEQAKKNEEEKKAQRLEEERAAQETERAEAERHQQWEREEAARQEQILAEAKEALKLEHEMVEQQSGSSGDEFVTSGAAGKPTNEVAALNLCQNNSKGDTAADAMFREELRPTENQFEEDVKELAVKTGGSRYSAGGANGSLQPQVSQGVPQTSCSPYLTGPTALQIKQRLQIGATPTMYHSDGMESDDSLASDNERQEGHVSYPALLSSTQSFRPDFNMADDDILSYTSTEFEGNDPIPASSSHFARDILLNMNLSDPSTLVQVQDYIRETKRQVEQERNQRTVLDNKLRLMAKEKQELSRKVESITEAKQSLEQTKLDLEVRIRSLEYNLSEEQEKRRNAELLLTKTKEQLARKEQQFTNELEAKQRAELTMRNIQLEMRAAQNKIKELEEEREELERQLQHEHSARKLQEQINQEQSRLAQQHQQETMLTSTAASRDPAAGDDGGGGDEGRSECDKLNAELYAVKMEMDRQRSRFKDEITLMASENEELQNRVEELKNDIKLNEEALAHATMQYNVQLGSLRSDALTSTSGLDKERAVRDKLETELDSLQKRLQGAFAEKDKAVHARNDLERDCQLEKQNHSRYVERKEEEVNMLKDNNQHLNQRLHSMETKLSSMENELHVSSTSLMERTSQLQQLRQEAERHKSAQNSFDTNVRLEKELNTKLQVKLESLQERLTQSQHEVMLLKQQLETLRVSSLNAASADSHEHLSTVINSLRSDSERTKALLEERNNSLMEQVQRLKEESRNGENRRNTLDADLRRLHTQHAELAHKLSFAEAQLQVMQKTREQVEQEKSQLKEELHEANERHRLAQEKCLEAQTRLAELTDRLNRAEHTSQLSTQNLATTSASFTAVARSKEEIEDTVQRLQVDNARLEADLRHERERAIMLQADLDDSHKVRSSLEALCSNLKSTTAHLEEKLGDETASRVILSKEARNSKALFKQELTARSRLGLRIVHLEKAQKTAQSKLEQAKTQEHEAEGHKTAVEVQLSEECQKSQQLQKELSNLKAHLKAAKKKLKDSGVNVSTHGDGSDHYAEFKRQVSTEGGKVSTPRGDSNSHQHNHYHHIFKSQVESGQVDVEELQKEMEMRYRRELNSKLDEINTYLEAQAHARDRLDTSRTDNETRLAAETRHLQVWASVSVVKLAISSGDRSSSD